MTIHHRLFHLVLVVIPLTGLLGWALAGRAIQPVNEVAQAAQKITGSNLSLQIPLRGSGDELDNLIEAFNRMTARLEDSFEQIRRFSTDVSHELRTPLTVIRGQLEVALFTAQTPEQYRDAMVNALEDVERLSSIVRALLLLSQAESGQVVLQKTELRFRRSGRGHSGSVPDSRRGEARAPNGRIEPDMKILADRIQIERLLSNLLSNAIKYTPAGGTVHVRVRREEKRKSLDRRHRRGHRRRRTCRISSTVSIACATPKPTIGTGAGLELCRLDREGARRNPKRRERAAQRNPCRHLTARRRTHPGTRRNPRIHSPN